MGVVASGDKDSEKPGNHASRGPHRRLQTRSPLPAPGSARPGPRGPRGLAGCGKKKPRQPRRACCPGGASITCTGATALHGSRFEGAVPASAGPTGGQDVCVALARSSSPAWWQRPFAALGGAARRKAGNPRPTGGHVTKPRGTDWSVASGPRPEGRAFAPGRRGAAGGIVSSRALRSGRAGRLAVRVAVGFRAAKSAACRHLNCALLPVLRDSVPWSPATCRLAPQSGTFQRRIQGPRGALGMQLCHAASHPRCPCCRGA